MKVIVRVEKTQIAYTETEMTPDEYEKLKTDGYHPVFDDLIEAVDLDDVTYDYSWEVI